MAQLFGHEKLKVYQKGLVFAALRSTLLDGLSRRVAACEHLDRAAESILVNIAEGNGRFTGTDQAMFFGIAYKSTVQSASLVDLATANGPSDVSRVDQGRELLRRIAAMLTSLSKVAAHDS